MIQIENIPRGHENAVQRPANPLEDRKLRREIEQANQNGDCIINVGKGYYRPVPGNATDEAELRQYLAKEMIKNTEQLVDEKIEDGEKVIIICTFTEEIEELKKYYGDKCVIYDGKMTLKQKDKAQDEFMNNPKVKVFIGQIIACSVGLTLTVAHTLVFNSYSWVAADNLQACDRIYRLNQTKDVTCIYQLFNDSISQNMFDKVMKKELIMNKTIKSEREK